MNKRFVFALAIRGAMALAVPARPAAPEQGAAPKNETPRLQQVMVYGEGPEE
jgi:hypothetical protein